MPRAFSVLQGWCLLKTNDDDEWMHCYVVVDNGLLLWYNDETKLKPISLCKLRGGDIKISNTYLEQFNNERIISINVDTINNNNSIIELGIMTDEVVCWITLLRLHNNDNMIKEIDLNRFNEVINNNDHDDVFTIIEDLKETVEIQLQDKIVSLDINITTNVVELVDNLIIQYNIKDDIKSFLEAEFLKSQLKSFQKYEKNLKNQISWMYKRLSDIEIYEQRAALAERHAELVSYSLDSIESLIDDIKEDDDDKIIGEINTATLDNNKTYIQYIKDLRNERVLLIKKLNAMKEESRRMTFQIRNQSSPGYADNSNQHKLRFELINLEDKYTVMKNRYDDIVVQFESSTTKLKNCEEKLAKVTMLLKAEQEKPHANLIESLNQDNSMLKSHIVTMRGELARLQSESEMLQTSAIDTVSALKDSGLISKEMAIGIEEIKSKDTYDIDLFGTSPTKSKKPLLPESSNPNNLASFKITNIIESRLFSDIYKKYVSDSSGLLTLQRMHRYVKEFNIVGTNQPGFLVLGEIDIIFKNVLKIIPDGEEVVIAKARPYSVRAGMNESVYKKDIQQYAVKTPEKFNLKNIYESKIAGAQSITRGQFIVANQHMACKIYSGLIESNYSAPLDCLPLKQQKIAVRAAMDTFLKKKLVPIVNSLNMVPWALINLDRALGILGTNSKISQSLISKAGLLHSWYCHYSLFENNSEKMSYKSLSKFAHNFAIVPYLLKEPQLHNIFKEMSSWNQADPNIVLRSLPTEIQEMHTTIITKHKENTTNRKHAETICFRSFICILSCIAIQSFTDHSEGKKVEMFFEWLSQSGGTYQLSQEKAASLNQENQKII